MSISGGIFHGNYYFPPRPVAGAPLGTVTEVVGVGLAVGVIVVVVVGVTVTVGVVVCALTEDVKPMVVTKLPRTIADKKSFFIHFTSLS